jgi:hypothetical protein
MVKEIALLTLLGIFLSMNSFANMKRSPYDIADLLGTYEVKKCVKQKYSTVTVSRKKAQSNLKKIVLSKRNFVTFWGKIENPSYYIAQLTPERDEVVYPRYLQLLFNYNGIYLDQLSFLTVRSSSNDASNEYLEIVDNETLLLEFCGWVYTLKRIK